MKHFRAVRRSKVSDLLIESLPCDYRSVRELLDLGSVYHNSEIGGIKSKTSPRRLQHDIDIEVGDYVRVHTSSRHYPVYETTDWNARVVRKSPNFILLNKPAGLPSHATADNSKQNCVEAAKKLLNCDVYLPHRLDTDTSGLLLLCTDKNFLVAINRAIKSRQVSKVYRALVISKPIMGRDIISNQFLPGSIWKSHLQRSTKSPKVYMPEADANSDSISCSLKLVSSR